MGRVNVTEAARRLGISRDSVYRWAEEGRLTAYKEAGRSIGTFFEETEIESIRLRHAKDPVVGSIRRRKPSRNTFLADRLAQADRHADTFASATPAATPEAWHQVLDFLSEWWFGTPLTGTSLARGEKVNIDLSSLLQEFAHREVGTSQVLLRWKDLNGEWRSVELVRLMGASLIEPVIDDMIRHYHPDQAEMMTTGHLSDAIAPDTTVVEPATLSEEECSDHA